MILKWEAEKPEDLFAIADDLLTKVSQHNFFCLHGDMGAGKTTFIKALCAFLRVKDEVHSPTFSIVNEYQRDNGEPVYHFDFYRIKSTEEAYDIGYENYFFSPYYCFVEWPEKIESLLNLPKADIFISAELNKRVITCRYE